ncbi:MAG: origin of replication binding protein-domain-containing protein [Linnemannia gamsii]|nr:MAG: origin of replication binding protein-domain-containing protein [Linnemannia gamsii]
MPTKFGSIYFGYDKLQDLGPQERAFVKANLNHDEFFVAYNHKALSGKTYCEYSSYPDLSAFLLAYGSISDKDRRFNEIIRDGHACAEYYDIDGKLSNSGDEGDTMLSMAQRLAEQEQLVLASFLEARNQFAPEYPVSEEQCRILSASSGSKVSLHIVIPQYVFENNSTHMKTFMDNFYEARGGRTFRKAEWHAASKNADDKEFYITNIAVQHTRVGPIARVSKGKIVISRSGLIATMMVNKDAKLPQLAVDAVKALFLNSKYASQFEFKYEGRLGFNQSIDIMATTCVRLPCSIPVANTTYCERYVKRLYLAPPRNKPFQHNGKDEPDTPPSLMIWSATGTGKTEFVNALVEENKGCKFVVVTCRRTLANTLGPRLGFTNYQDIKEPRIACDKLVIQAESLHRISTRYYGENVILILDEFSSLCEQMTSTSTMGHNHDYNNQILREFIKGVSRVICLDADLTDRDVQLVKGLRNDVHVIHNTFKPQEGHRVVMYEKKSSLVSKTLHQQLSDAGFHGKCVTSLTDDKDKRAISEDINTIIASCDYFIHTPTISVGIDCNVEECVDYVVGFFSTKSQVNVETCRQMMRRVRHVRSKKYLVHVDQRTNSQPTTVEAVHGWIKKQADMLMGGRDLEGLRLNIGYGGNFSLPEGFYSHLWTNVRIKRNLSVNGFMQRFIQQMLDAGCTVQGENGAISTDQILKSETEILDAIKKEQQMQVANAQDLTYEEFSKLCEVRELTLPEKHAMSKYRLMTTYNIDDPSIITPDFVALYDNDREKRIYSNLCALSTRAMQDGLDSVRQKEYMSLAFSIENGYDTRVPHKLDESQHNQLKYAVDILTACGFSEVFSNVTVPAKVFKETIDHLWETGKDGLQSMCTTLGLKMPTSKNMTFKNKKGFLSDRVLFEVLGVKIISANKRRTEYRLVHYSNVGSLRQISVRE